MNSNIFCQYTFSPTLTVLIYDTLCMYLRTPFVAISGLPLLTAWAAPIAVALIASEIRLIASEGVAV